MSLLCNLYSDGRWRFFPLGLSGCSFACGVSVCCLSASLGEFLCEVFCISLSWIAEGGSGGVPAEYGRFLQAFLIWRHSSALASCLSLTLLSHRACLPL
jgi:hypothetical protein